MTATNNVIIATLLALCASVPPAPSADDTKKMQEITAAAERGEPDAQYRLAKAFQLGNGVPADQAKALEWMKKAAAQGHADALGDVGYFYAKGAGVPKDDKEAIAWFRKGAEKGSVKAQLNLGLAIAAGNGVSADAEEGLRWIDRAAGQGLPAALYSQAETYFWGKFGRAVDYPKALPLYQKAADAGHSGAQNNVGVMLRDGKGAAIDEKAAIGWFRKAAGQGNARGQSNLGHALGVESPDRAMRVEALKWIMLAADQKEITAIKTLDELTPNLSQEENSEARKLADEFQKAHSAGAR